MGARYSCREERRKSMDETVLLRFMNEGSLMKVDSFAADEGIAFKRPKDASPLNIGFGLQSLLPGRLDPVRLRHDWRAKEFSLDARMHNDGVLLSGFNGDREGLPFGAYDISVELESYRFKNGQQRLVLHKGQQAELVFEVDPDRRHVNLRDNFDSATASFVGKSNVDGQTLDTWLTSATPQEA